MGKVFLGGTCNGSLWREDLIKLLDIEYFNPVVEDWTPDCMAEERKQREDCDFCLYVVTPKMTGVYSIAEVVDDSNKRPHRTMFCVLEKDVDVGAVSLYEPVERKEISFSPGQLKSLTQVGALVERNGGKVFNGLEDVADLLNGGQ